MKTEERAEKRRRKSVGKGIFIFIVLVLVLPEIRANFVCGKVLDYNESDEVMHASWFPVRAFYPEEREKFTTCQISPAENKYCCDTEAIPGRKWKIGDRVEAEIFDNITGYAAGPVSVITTGEGYDVLPEMQLKKLMKIYNPTGKLVFSNNSEFLLNASFAEPYTFIEIEKNNSREVLCENCTNFSGKIEANYGWNEFTLFSSFKNNVFSKKLGLWVLSGFEFKRNFECEGCLKNIIKTNRKVKVRIFINLSHPVENLELKEYVPVDFKILETDGKIENYSESHRVIVWNVSGKEIVKSYEIKSPWIWFFPKKYIFKTELENKVLDETIVKVYRWIRFFSFNKRMKFGVVKRVKNYRVSPSNPLIVKLQKKTKGKLVIVPKNEFSKIRFDLEELKNPHIPNLISYYKFDTDLKEEDIDKIYLEIKIRKKYMRWRAYKGIKMYIFKDNNWIEKELEKYDEDKEYFYYRGFLGPTKKLVISGIRESFWDIFDFIF